MGIELWGNIIKFHSGHWILFGLLVICTVALGTPCIYHLIKRRYTRSLQLGVLLVGLIVISILICIEYAHSNDKNVTHTDILSKTVIFNFVNLFGIGLTILGAFWAYKQFKMQEDRIDCYEDFYKAAIKLLKDKGKFVHFYGSTLIPGHVTFGDENYVKEDGHYFKALTDRIEKFYNDSGQKKDSSKFILPKDYKIAYDRYRGKEYKNHGKGNRFCGTENEIITKKNEMQHMQDGVNHYALIRIMPNVQILSLNGEQEKLEDDPFLRNFYLSNGKTMIYAISVTHEQAPIIDKDEEPVFVGFKTQKASIINVFKKRFERQWNDIKNTNDESITHPEQSANTA